MIYFVACIVICTLGEKLQKIIKDANKVENTLQQTSHEIFIAVTHMLSRKMNMAKIVYSYVFESPLQLHLHLRYNYIRTIARLSY